MTIENCADTECPQGPQDVEIDSERDDMLKYLAQNTKICFKSQQMWEPDLTETEKFQIGLDLFLNNKINFLLKFGQHLNNGQINYFKNLVQIKPDEEMEILINDLEKKSLETQNVIIKNRRYKAMINMIQQDNTYFSETEMMKRNPHLYNQLVGQYLTSDEVEERDRYSNADCGLVTILMEGIERDNAEEVRKQHEEIEKDQMKEDSESEENSEEVPVTSHWGEIGDFKIQQKAFSSKGRKHVTKITPEEQKLLKEEFVTTMYNSFLDGKDEDFEYDAIDNNTTYDNIEEMEHDEEEKYFNSEPEKIGNNHVDSDSSEDELDIFMRTLS